MVKNLSSVFTAIPFTLMMTSFARRPPVEAALQWFHYNQIIKHHNSTTNNRVSIKAAPGMDHRSYMHSTICRSLGVNCNPKGKISEENK